MAIKEMTVDYEFNGAMYEAFMAWDDTRGPAPAVLVSHAWGGRSDFEDNKARGLAAQGYVGFALDMYGKGVRGTSTEENAALMTPLVENRGELQARMARALEVVREQSVVDASQVAAMGYCFGGLCVLDLARSGADVAGVISIHGLFNPADNIENPKIGARVLALHGWDDPMAQPDSALALAAEMSAAGADWQLHAYGGTMHAFTNPQANDPEMGTVYSAAADRRAAQAIDNFLGELFAA